ncbi:MAG: hypothetical protein H6835_07080 [Planctomycetes bacterium]|nr:hypothetical protein [Planctomycetota bacterium]
MNERDADSLWDTDYLWDPDYLWDTTAPVEPDVAALERALAPLRWSGSSAPEHVLTARASGARPWRWFAAAAAAAALLLAWGAAAWWRGSELRPGDAGRHFVAGQQALHLAMGELATVTLSVGGELELVHWRDDELRLRLRRGRLQADIAEPPAVVAGFFVVEVPIGSANGERAAVDIVDRGCRFEVDVERVGEVAVTVQEGAVSVAVGSREAWVPAGAGARVVDGFVGTPLFADASGDVRQLVRLYDKSVRGGSSAEERRKLAQKLAMLSRAPHDALPLWHLLLDDDAFVRKIVTEALYRLAGAPDGSAVLERVYRADEWLPLLRGGVWRAR